MTHHGPDILDAVSIAEAAERSGLDPVSIAVLAVWEEPSGLDGAGPMRPVIRSYPSESGLLINLADAIEVAPAHLAILAGEADDALDGKHAPRVVRGEQRDKRTYGCTQATG